MIVTVKNEVNEPEVRLRAHRNKGSREPSRQYKTQDKNRLFFFKPEIWAVYQHASIRFAFNPVHESRTRQPAAKTPLLSTHRSVSPSGELSNGDGSPVRFYLLLGIRSFPFLYLLLTHRSVRLHGSSNLYQQSTTARSFLSTHRSFRLQSTRRMGAQTDTLQWRHIYCSLYIYR